MDFSHKTSYIFDIDFPEGVFDPENKIFFPTVRHYFVSLHVDSIDEKKKIQKMNENDLKTYQEENCNVDPKTEQKYYEKVLYERFSQNANATENLLLEMQNAVLDDLTGHETPFDFAAVNVYRKITESLEYFKKKVNYDEQSFPDLDLQFLHVSCLECD